jgi:D-alanyl-D-alanine carboxypeptidase
MQKRGVKKRTAPRVLFIVIALCITALLLAGAAFIFFGLKHREIASAEGKEKALLFADDRIPYESEPWFLDPDKLLLVVDRETALGAKDVPEDLVSLSAQGVLSKPEGLRARRIIIDDFKELCARGKEAGFEFYVFSAYRSYHEQEQTFTYWVEMLGEEEARRSSALAGHSEHQLGTTLDISATGFKGDVYENFGDSLPGKWLAANAYKYGFVMSYPKDSESVTGYIYEPWHFRYVGKRVAEIIAEKAVIPSLFIKDMEQRRTNGTHKKSS